MSIKRLLKDVFYKWKFCTIWLLILFFISMFTPFRFSLTLNLLFMTAVMFPFAYAFLAILYSKLSGWIAVLALIGDLVWLSMGWTGYLCLISWISELYMEAPYLVLLSTYSGNLLIRYQEASRGIVWNGPGVIYRLLFLNGAISFYTWIMLYCSRFYLGRHLRTGEKAYEKMAMRDICASWILGSVSLAPLLLSLHPMIPPVLAIMVIAFLMIRFSKVRSMVKDRERAALGLAGRKLAVHGNLVMHCRDKDLFTCIDTFSSIGDSLTEISYGPYMVCSALEYRSHVLTKEGEKPDALILDYEEQDMARLLPEERARIMAGIKNMVMEEKRVFIYYRVSEKKKLQESQETQELRRLPLTFITERALTDTGTGGVDELKGFLMMEPDDSWGRGMRQLVYHSIEQIPDTLKYSFITQERENVCNAGNTEAFYQCIKMSEYMIHYRALAKLASGEAEETEEITFSIGTWQKIQKEEAVRYDSPEILEAERLVRQLLEQKDRMPKSSLTYKDITEIIVRLRNRYIGHGTLTYSVSKELIQAVVILTGAVYQVFSHDGYELTPEQLVDEKYLLGEAVPVCRIDEGQISLLYFVTYTDMGNLCEYMNYNSGMISRNMDLVKWHLVSGARR